MEKFIYKIPGMDFDPILFLIFIGLPAIAALLCLYSAFRFVKRARLLEDTPFSKIRSAAQGYIEINGKVFPLEDNPVLGALSRKPCIWYRYRIEELKTYHTQTETLRRWEIIAQDASHIPFRLQDNTGECVILPRGAEVATNSTLRWYGNSIPPPPFPKPSFWTMVFGTSGRLCYIEERLELDTEVYATGMFHTLPRNDTFIQSLPELQAYITQTNTSTLHILDNSGLGQKQSLLISTTPEKKVVREYRFKAFIFFLSFLFFAIVLITSSYPAVMRTTEQWQHAP